MSLSTSWIVLLIAGILEVVWAIGLKYTDGFNFRARPSACTITLAAMIASMYLLSLAVRQIPIGTGYAVWVGIGAAGAAIFGIVLFKEPVSFARVLCLTMLIAGTLGLKLLSQPASPVP